VFSHAQEKETIPASVNLINAREVPSALDFFYSLQFSIDEVRATLLALIDIVTTTCFNYYNNHASNNTID
jgi:hypothetical protein